ncbi:MAG: class I SAM-dependent methyltransferase, partial [Hyphomicrobiales bacterium]|nr:class I SAM-dependent methyltransferase [Hyphomicrobiales bacterium]
MQSQYSEAVIASMTLIFGDGFLSPGGEDEVKRIIQSQTGGTNLAGRKVLDWGCGLGGTALALAQQCHADDVLGIDIEPGNIQLAEALVNRHGCSGQIAFQLVEPGPMPLAENFADVIFTKEALCHIADKARSLPIFTG